MRFELMVVLVVGEVALALVLLVGGFFGIPVGSPRSLFIANAAVFTSPSDADHFSTAIETIGRA